MTTTDNEVHIGAQGRIVIPVALRKELQLKPGDQLVARRVDDTLVFERRETIERRLLARFKNVPEHVHLSEELIAERRAESKNDENSR